MANLTDAASAWVDGVYQLETTDPVMGGVPNPATGAGIDNIPHLQLAQRTQFLRGEVETLQNGAGYRSITAITGSQTLVAADMGKCLVSTDTSATTITLPALGGAPAGSVLEIVNAGTGLVTVQRAGSDQIDVGHSNVTSIAVLAGRTLRLIRAAGATVWYVVGAPAVDTTDVGRIGMFAMSTAPAGWLKANGALVSRTVYAALFSAIGTQFGAGNGTNNFALPDLRGEFLRGWDDGRGVDVGRAFGSFQADELRSHAHNYATSNAVAGNAAASVRASAQGDNTLSVLAAGGSETRPRNVALLCCIKF